MIPNSLVVAASKGGAGKTSLAGALASLAAVSGWRVLLVDLDPQGNQAREFGYMSESDGGRGLFNAVVTGSSVAPMRQVRENLDVVAGGRHLRKLVNWLAAEAQDDPMAIQGLEHALAEAASEVDLVVVDTPPGEMLLHAAIANMGRFIVIPTQGDAASNDGISEVLTLIDGARHGNPPNPYLELLGVVVMFVPSGGTVLDRRIREDLTSLLGDEVTLFTPSVRYSKQAALDLRERGLTVGEYEALRGGPAAPRFSSAAGGLAEDYQRLSEAILSAFSSRVAEVERR